MLGPTSASSTWIRRSGVFSLLALDPRFTLNSYGAFTCAVVEGARSALLGGDEYATNGMPLPAQQAAP